MSIDENGFLGKDALILAAQIRERNKSLFELCFEINGFAQKLKYELEVHNLDPQEFFAAAFFIRVLESAQGAVILVERGLELEAATILRSAFDSLIYLKCSVEDEQFAYDYMNYAEIKRRDDLKNILKFKIYENEKSFGNEADIIKMISDIEKGFEKSGKKMGQFRQKFLKKELAEKANMSILYASFYAVTSDAAHTGMGALRQHLKTDEQGKIIEIIHGPSDEQARMHLTAFSEFVLCASAYICELFKIEKAEIDAFYKKLSES